LDREREAEARKKRDDEAEAKRVRRAAEDAAIEGAKALAVEAAKQAAEESKATRAAKVKSERRVEDVQAILAALQLTPGSVFGKQISITGKMVDSAEICLTNTAIVDPAGLGHIQPPGRPSGAGGFSRELYRRVGILGAEAFPREVVENVKKVGDAFCHTYQSGRDALDVIHAVGPDFRMLPKGEATYPRGLARAQLAAVYGSVLRAHLESTRRTVRCLRLVPVSGGIFAGSLLPDIPRLTFEAMGDAIMSLSDPQRQALRNLKVALHVFREDEWDAFIAGGFMPGSRGVSATQVTSKSTRENEMAMLIASERGQPAEVRRLLDLKTNIHATLEGHTALHYAATNGHAAIVELLLAGGADANAENTNQARPLHCAANGGHTAVVLLLLKEADADVNAVSAAAVGGHTALGLATKKGHTDVVALLESRGAKS
jgi:hypothetical protein